MVQRKIYLQPGLFQQGEFKWLLHVCRYISSDPVQWVTLLHDEQTFGIPGWLMPALSRIFGFSHRKDYPWKSS